MNEIIDAILSLLSVLKYGSVINRHRNYAKKIGNYLEIPYPESAKYLSYVKNELSALKVKPHSQGHPKYAIFQMGKRNTKVYIVNEQLQFMYRLENYDVVTTNFYINLTGTL